MAKIKKNKKLSLEQRKNRIKERLSELHQCKELLAEEGILPDQEDRRREYELQSNLRKLSVKPKRPFIRS